MVQFHHLVRKKLQRPVGVSSGRVAARYRFQVRLRAFIQLALLARTRSLNQSAFKTLLTESLADPDHGPPAYGQSIGNLAVSLSFVRPQQCECTLYRSRRRLRLDDTFGIQSVQPCICLQPCSETTSPGSAPEFNLFLRIMPKPHGRGTRRQRRRRRARRKQGFFRRLFGWMKQEGHLNR